MTIKYPLFKAHIPTDEALLRVGNVFDSGYYNEGVQVTELTKQLEQHLDVKHLVLVNSCTSALTMALKLAGVGKDDLVFSTSMTCVATNMPIMNVGAIPSWIDIDPKSGMMSATSLEAVLAMHARLDALPKAVIVVAWAGVPPELETISSLCKQYNVKLILDAAHAFGAKYAGYSIAEWADYTCYSFQAIKHFTTGDGGAIVIKDISEYIKAKSMKWFGLDRDKTKDAKGDWRGQQWDVDIEESGYKFNMNNITAAIGLAQLNSCDFKQRLEQYNKNASILRSALEDPRLTPQLVDKQAIPSYWVATFTLNSKLDNASLMIVRDNLLKMLNSFGVAAGVVHIPNHEYSVFSHCFKELPNTSKFYASQFNLPCGWWLTTSDINQIAYLVLKCLDEVLPA